MSSTIDVLVVFDCAAILQNTSSHSRNPASVPA